MADSESAPDNGGLGDLRAEIRLVEEEIEQARRAAADARQAIGGHAEGAIDSNDRSSAIEQAEEQERLVDVLTARRETLLERQRTAG